MRLSAFVSVNLKWWSVVRALLDEKLSNIILDINCFCSKVLIVEVWFANCLLRSNIASGCIGWVGLSAKLVKDCGLSALMFCLVEVSGVPWS